MTPEELRRSIPATEETIYLNTGASGPSPEPVVSAIESTLEQQEFVSPRGDGMYSVAEDAFNDARKAVAGFIGADADSIVLTASTTDGINRVATAMDWGPDDTVVISDLEHAAGQLPWKRARREYGIDLKVVESDQGRFDLDVYEEALTDASLLCVSSLDWIYGRTHPIEALGEIAEDASALTMIDAVQSVGQQPIDVTEWEVDFLAGAGHKWLLGPWGAGFLYVDESVVTDLSPAHVGYRSVKDPYADEYEYVDTASRFEVSTTNPAVYAGLGAAIDTIESIGLETVREHIQTLTSQFKAEIPPDRLLSPETFHSGLVTVRVPDPESTVERLADDDIVIRSLPLSGSIRFSFHAFNTLDEVYQVVDSLQVDWD